MDTQQPLLSLWGHFDVFVNAKIEEVDGADGADLIESSTVR